MPATLPVLRLQMEFACLGLTRNSASVVFMAKNVIKDAPILALNLLWKIADATPISAAFLHVPIYAYRSRLCLTQLSHRQ